MYPTSHHPYRLSQPLLFIVIMAVMSLVLIVRVLPAPSVTPMVTQPMSAATLFDRVPLYFEENYGQTSEAVRYLARGAGYQVFMTPDTIAFRLFTDAGSYNAHVSFVGANPQPSITGERQQAGISSYMMGDESAWVTNVPHYGAVRYTELYAGIDAVFYGNPQQLQYDFIVAPMVDPSVIRLNIAPAESVVLADNGDLHLGLGDQTVVMHAPYTYQVIDGVQHHVDSAFAIEGETIGFTIGAYDPAHELIIDPVVTYMSFFGGNKFDYVAGIEVDDFGNLYLAGATATAEASFPETVGPDLTFNDTDNASDAFVAKFAPNGTTLMYAGYIGGAKYDGANDLAIDAQGNLYIIGETYSPQGSFPEKVGPDLTYNGGGEEGGDVFIAKVNATGTELVYAGYIGSGGLDYAYAIDVDAEGAAYFAGYSKLHEAGLAELPLTVGPGSTRGLDDDVFVGKVNPNGQTFDYLGLLGGNQYEHANDIVVDATGSAYVTGHTASSNFPVAGGLSASNGSSDIFIFKVKPDGTGLLFSGHIGGDVGDYGYGLTLDSAGAIYIVGGTSSSTATFPAVGGGFNLGSGSGIDGFITKLSATGTTIWRSRFGGSGTDNPSYVVVDSAGRVHFAGNTNSTEATFPETNGSVGALDLTHNGAYDAFLGRVSANGATLDYLGYLGGSSSDGMGDITLDSGGNLYISGSTYGSGFPTTPGAFDTSYNSGGDGFFGKYGTAPLVYPQMLLNNSFETAGATAKKAANWSNTNPTSADRRLCSTPSKPIETTDGDCVFQFSAGSAPAKARTLKQVINVPTFDATGKQLVLSMNVEGNKLKTGMKVIVTVTYTDNTTAKLNLPIAAGTYEFAKFGGELALTKPVKKVVFAVNAGKVTGRLRIDNVTLSFADVPTRLPFPLNDILTRDGAALTLPAAPDGFRK